jgi:hypothetical protein
MDPINVQLFKPDSGRPDEWYVRWTNGESADIARVGYGSAVYQRESDGLISILYPYYDATYSRDGIAALLLDEDGNLLINKKWYVYNTTTNQVNSSVVLPSAILNDEVFILNGGSTSGLTGCEGDTGTGGTGVVNLYSNALSYVGYTMNMCKNFNAAGPGYWPDDVAIAVSPAGNGCRYNTIRRDGASAQYASNAVWRDGGTILFPDTNQFIMGKKRFRGTSDWNALRLTAGTTEATYGLPSTETNVCFGRSGPSCYLQNTGYSEGADTATCCFREIVGSSYYTVAYPSVGDPWGTPNVRNGGNAYSFGYNSQNCTVYGCAHLPDAYSGFQGLWVTSMYATTPGFQIQVIDDYYVSEIAAWQYKYSGTNYSWAVHNDPASWEHVIFQFESSDIVHIFRLHISSIIAGLGFASGGIVASAPTTHFIRYSGFANLGGSPEWGSAPVATTPTTPSTTGVAMITPTIDHFQQDTD